MATKEKTAEEQKAAEAEKTPGKRDIVREQENAEKSAQELVQERHMNPEAFGQ